MHPDHSRVQIPPRGLDIPCNTNYATRTLGWKACAVSCRAPAPLGVHNREPGQKGFILIHWGVVPRVCRLASPPPPSETICTQWSRWIAP